MSGLRRYAVDAGHCHGGEDGRPRQIVEDECDRWSLRRARLLPSAFRRSVMRAVHSSRSASMSSASSLARSAAWRTASTKTEIHVSFPSTTCRESDDPSRRYAVSPWMYSSRNVASTRLTGRMESAERPRRVRTVWMIARPTRPLPSAKGSDGLELSVRECRLDDGGVRRAVHVFDEVIHESFDMFGSGGHELCFERVIRGPAQPVLSGPYSVKARGIGQQGALELQEMVGSDRSCVGDRLRGIAHCGHIVGNEDRGVTESFDVFRLPQLCECDSSWRSGRAPRSERMRSPRNGAGTC